MLIPAITTTGLAEARVSALWLEMIAAIDALSHRMHWFAAIAGCCNSGGSLPAVGPDESSHLPARSLSASSLVKCAFLDGRSVGVKIASRSVTPAK
jgi:hypothetical protein